MNVLSSVEVFVLDPCPPLSEDLERNSELLIFIFIIDKSIDLLSIWIQTHLDYSQEALGSDLKPHG